MDSPIITKRNLIKLFDSLDTTGKGKVRVNQWPDVYIRSLEYHTSFIDYYKPNESDKNKMIERKYCLKHRIFDPPMCVYCGQKMRRFDYKNRTGYRPFCDTACFDKPKDKQEQKRLKNQAIITPSFIDDDHILMSWDQASMMIEKHLIEDDKVVSMRCREDYLFNNGLIHLLEAIEAYAHKDCETFFEKIYCVKNKIDHRPKCKRCHKNNVSFGYNVNEGKNTYLTYCSKECSDNSYDRIQKSKERVVEKYGVDNVSKAESVRQKISNNIKKAYQVNGDDILSKREQTNQILYGANHWNASEEGREYLRNKQNNEVDLDRARERRKNTLMECYGVSHHSLIGKDNDVMTYLYDYNWLYDQYVTQQKTLTEISKELGGIRYSWVQERLKSFDIEPRNNTDSYSLAEQEIYDFLVESGVSDLERGTRSLIPPYEVDIYSPSHMIAIEYNGLYWHSDKFKDNHYHKMKYEKCRKQGVQLITIFEDEWNEKHDIIKNTLLYKFGLDQREKVFARKCKIGMIDTETYRRFLERNHILGLTNSSIRFGLFYNETLIGVMGFSKSTQQKASDYDFILERYATSVNAVGGFTKLLSWFCSNYEWETIETFADKRWSDGSLYEKAGFHHKKNISPDYSYVKGDQRISKRNFRSTTGLPDLPGWEQGIRDEKILTQMNGYYRIYDCGKLVYRLIKT